MEARESLIEFGLVRFPVSLIILIKTVIIVYISKEKNAIRQYVDFIVKAKVVTKIGWLWIGDRGVQIFYFFVKVITVWLLIPSFSDSEFLIDKF